MLDISFAIAPMMDWTDRHCRVFHRLMTRRARLYTEMLTTGAILHGENPHWGPRGMRFDAWFVAPEGQLHHVPDAFRDMG